MIQEFFAGFMLGLAGTLAFVHVNFVLGLAQGVLPSGFSKAIFAASLSFSKLVFELVPTLFFTVPSATFGISILPSQKLFLEGKGVFALKTILNSFFFSMIISAVLLPPVLLALPLAFAAVQPHVGFALAAVTLYALCSKEKPAESVFAFALSGALGLAVLSKPLVREPLFPLLSGLFGIPALLFGLQAAAPKRVENSCNATVCLKTIAAGTIAGAFSSLLPAMTPILAVSIVFIFLENKGEETFLQASSAVLASKTFFDFAAFYAIGKARSGAVAFAAQELSTAQGLFLTLAAGAAAMFLAIAVMLKTYKIFCKAELGGVKAKLAVAAFIACAASATGGVPSLLILSVSACAGVAIALLGVNKSTALGCLIVPSLCYHFAISLF